MRVNAGPDGPELHDSVRPLHPALLRHTQGTGPVIIMIHGYRFRPGDPANCPHRHIFALNNGVGCRKAVSWPQNLGVSDPNRLGIAFGWNSLGSLWRAQGSALRAGDTLARLVLQLRRIAPRRPLHMIAHSLGAQVAFAALERLAPRDVHRVVVLNGAAYQSQGRAAMESCAGGRAELINVITSGSNAVFDIGFERLIRPALPGDRALGRGLHIANAVTLDLDNPGLLNQLKSHGLRITGPERRICHWSTYLRPGVFDLYHDLLHQPQRLSLNKLRQMVEAASPIDRFYQPKRRLALPQTAKPAS